MTDTQLQVVPEQALHKINLEDAIGRVEKRGIEFIPEESRYSNPRKLTWVWIGSQMTFGVILLGWLPIAFGLGWWDAVTSMTAGLLFGMAFFGWFSLIGPRTGTNSAVSTGAHFGVVGRLVGSFQALFIAIGYAAITVWVSGDMLVTGFHVLFGLSDGNESRAIAYAVVSLAMILVAVFGHANVVAMQKVVAIIVLIIIVVAVFVFLPNFDANYAGPGEYLLGGFWPTWIFSAVIAAQLPISYTPFANDFARYVSSKKWKDSKVFWGASIGMFIGCWVALLFGAYAATMFGPDTVAFGDGVIAISPIWFVLPLLVIGLLGSFAQGSLALYGTGLDTSSIIPGLKRVPATLVLSALALVFVYFGAFVWNAIDAVSAFILILLVLVVPWMVITLIGFWYNRGRYWPADLQVFNVHAKGGAYWYTWGVNWRAAAGYVVGVISGLMYVYTTIFVGPLAESVGGVDVSIFTSGIAAGIVYALLLWAFPERNHRKAGETGITSSVPVVARDSALM